MTAAAVTGVTLGAAFGPTASVGATSHLDLTAHPVAASSAAPPGSLLYAVASGLTPSGHSSPADLPRHAAVSARLATRPEHQAPAPKHQAPAKHQPAARHVAVKAVTKTAVAKHPAAQHPARSTRRRSIRRRSTRQPGTPRPSRPQPGTRPRRSTRHRPGTGRPGTRPQPGGRSPPSWPSRSRSTTP